MQTAFTFAPDSAPPELLRQIRSGSFRRLAQVVGGVHALAAVPGRMKQWMDNAVAFRKMSNDFMANVRNEMQAPSRDDIDTIMLAVRHMEKRVLDRVGGAVGAGERTEQASDGASGRQAR